MFLWLMNCSWVNKDYLSIYLSIYLSDYSQTCIKQSPTENDRLLQVPQNWGMPSGYVIHKFMLNYFPTFFRVLYLLL